VFLDRIKEAFDADPQLENLLLAPYFATAIDRAQAAWRHVVSTAALLGIPTPAFSAALAYFDAYRRARLPANLLQAQRDYFGAHTFERVDMPGTYHVDWLSLRRPPRGA
jgi:6-phosphogluconate dehydrogenase